MGEMGAVSLLGNIFTNLKFESLAQISVFVLFVCYSVGQFFSKKITVHFKSAKTLMVFGFVMYSGITFGGLLASTC
jgi:ABC-type transporter Mla subunit MlaD